ncbi:MAG: hypothetical protein ACAH59_05355 [Pseudobdellovibrionaceae bacterium]
MSINSKGQALLTAIVLTLGVGLISGYLMQKSQQTDVLLKAPRIRSSFIAAQAKLRLLSMQPTTFRTTGCPGGVAICLRNNLKDDIEILIPGAECELTPPQLCGVKVGMPGNLSLVQIGSTNHIMGTLIYDGIDFPFEPINIDILVPNDTLQVTATDCFTLNPDQPVFAGMNPDNTPNCQPLPAGNNCSGLGGLSAGPGQYVVSVDPLTLKLTCANLPTTLGCEADEYMTDLRWGSSGLEVVCVPRPSPLTRLGFTQGRASEVVALDEAPRPAGTCVGTPVAGVCGPANGQTLAAPPPLANRCSAGSSSAIVGGATGPWTWICRGVFGSTTNANCSAASSVTPPTATCGAADGTSRAAAPTTGLCAVGTASAVAGTGPWAWSCTSGSTSASCSASTTAGACTIQARSSSGVISTVNMSPGATRVFLMGTTLLSASPNLIIWTDSMDRPHAVCPTSTCTCWRMTCLGYTSMFVPYSDYPDQPTCRDAGARDACVSATSYGCSPYTCAEEQGVCN